MNDKFKPLPRNINKEKLEQFSKDFSVELFSPDVSPVSQFITEYSIKVHKRLEDEVFGVCSEIALANGIKYEYAMNKDFIVKAITKQIPAKVTHEASLLCCCTCPTCKNVVDKFEKFGLSTIRVTYKHCQCCGQKLDWSEINEPAKPTKTNFEACQTDFD